MYSQDRKSFRTKAIVVITILIITIAPVLIFTDNADARDSKAIGTLTIKKVKKSTWSKKSSKVGTSIYSDGRTATGRLDSSTIAVPIEKITSKSTWKKHGHKWKLNHFYYGQQLRLSKSKRIKKTIKVKKPYITTEHITVPVEVPTTYEEVSYSPIGEPITTTFEGTRTEYIGYEKEVKKYKTIKKKKWVIEEIGSIICRVDDCGGFGSYTSYGYSRVFDMISWGKRHRLNLGGIGLVQFQYKD